WLGRTDLRFLQYDTFASPDAPPYFSRRPFLAALLLAELTDGNARLDRWRDVDGVLHAFVGESDNMTVADFPRLREVTGTQTAAQLAALSDDAIAQPLLDDHGADFWGGSLYSAWLGALRGLSVPGGDPTSAVGLPAVMQTEPWARRMLNTQLASWAELRHDTLLYAKQSYTAIPLCDF